MDGAEIAADTLDEALAAGDFTAGFLRRYHDRWMAAFGWDFRWSRMMAIGSARFPAFLDGCAALMQSRGTEFLVEWAEAMTGALPKRTFFRPGLLLPMLAATARQWWQRPPPLPARL
jgi:flavin-dependent dehydrogenase